MHTCSPLADKISNLRALATNLPSNRERDRRLQYIAWARAVVEGLRGISPQLEQKFDDAADAALQ